MAINIPEERDITRVILNRALRDKPNNLLDLSKLFEELMIDRMVQAYGERAMLPAERAIEQGKSDFRLGQEDMLFKIKVFLSNLATISEEVNDSEFDVEDLVDRGDISEADLILARKLNIGKKVTDE